MPLALGKDMTLGQKATFSAGRAEEAAMRLERDVTVLHLRLFGSEPVVLDDRKEGPNTAPPESLEGQLLRIEDALVRISAYAARLAKIVDRVGHVTQNADALPERDFGGPTTDPMPPRERYG